VLRLVFDRQMLLLERAMQRVLEELLQIREKSDRQTWLHVLLAPI
jgi:hypothetical protein